MAEDKSRVKRIFHPEKKDESRKGLLRVAAYCRVSTKSDEQIISYETQVAVYQNKIEREPDWILAGIYADHGLSGTRAEKRPQFLQMIKDCEDGKIDVVITKSVSRFSRNTLDAVHYIQKLRNMGIRLIFEKEKIDTDNEYSAMLLTVMAAFAQEESHSHSENVKWGKRKKAIAGKIPLYPPYGYKTSDDGEKMIVVSEEAKVVRWVFEAYEHGMTISAITAELLSNGTPAPRINNGNTVGRWEETRIWQMLNNVKYMGDIISQKRYTPDFKNGRQIKNNGELPQRYIRDHHEAIITEKQFNRVGDILLMKSTSRKRPVQYPFSDMLKCPLCGHSLCFERATQFKYPTLFCNGEGACMGFAIERRLVENALLKAYAELNMNKLQALVDSGSREAKTLWEVKQKEPTFLTVEYWWLDEFIEKIQFGKHTFSPSELAAMTKENRDRMDDSKILIAWKCGIKQVFSTEANRFTQCPRYRAKLWKDHILANEKQYSEKAESLKRLRQERV